MNEISETGGKVDTITPKKLNDWRDFIWVLGPYSKFLEDDEIQLMGDYTNNLFGEES